MLVAIRATLASLKRVVVLRHRVRASKARDDRRTWVVTRRARTRHLIELGGLVVKAGLVELTDDDRAVLFGAFTEIADRLHGEDRDQALLLWRRRGRRAFEASAAAARENPGDKC